MNHLPWREAIRELNHSHSSRRPIGPSGLEAYVKLSFPAHTPGRQQRQTGYSSRAEKPVPGLYFTSDLEA